MELWCQITERLRYFRSHSTRCCSWWIQRRCRCGFLQCLKDDVKALKDEDVSWNKWWKWSICSFKCNKLFDYNLQFQLGWSANSIYLAEGEYPTVMVDQIRDFHKWVKKWKSRLQNKLKVDQATIPTKTSTTSSTKTGSKQSLAGSRACLKVFSDLLHYDGAFEDNDRIDYLKDHFVSISKAITEGKCGVTAYTIWSALDNFE